ncbi:hypothetical protein [Acidithiobacillus thiooxidans]|uniref:hypothetical protein n=1 Tax=Acidithiobacillus thiooxidans TaxID=930 RepID=UPI003562F6AB|nr:hypothetical protein [Acidithiobacillus sp.]
MQAASPMRGLRIALTLSVRYIWRLLVFLLLFCIAYFFYVYFFYGRIHTPFGIKPFGIKISVWGFYLPISILFGVWLWSGSRLLRSVSIKGHLYSCYRRRSTNEYWLDTLRGWWGFIWRRSLIYLSLLAMFSGVESVKYFFTINNFAFKLFSLASPLWLEHLPIDNGVFAVRLGAAFLSIPLTFIWLTMLRRKPCWIVADNIEVVADSPIKKTSNRLFWLILVFLLMTLYKLVCHSGVFIPDAHVVDFPDIPYIYPQSSGVAAFGFSETKHAGQVMLNSIPSSVGSHVAKIILTLHYYIGTPFAPGPTVFRFGMLSHPGQSLPAGWKSSVFHPGPKALVVHTVASNFGQATRYAESACSRIGWRVHLPYATIIRGWHHYEFVFSLHHRPKTSSFGNLNCQNSLLKSYILTNCTW